MPNVRYRIREPHGGDLRVIGDLALPFFPGWLVVEVIDGPPEIPLPAMVVIHGDDADLPRPDTLTPVIWYGSVPPENLNVPRGDKWIGLAGGNPDAVIATVEAEEDVAPSGTWDFAQMPTVAGLPISNGSTITYDAATGAVYLNLPAGD